MAVKRSCTLETPRTPWSESRLTTAGEGCHADVPWTVVALRIPTTRPRRFRSTTSTRTFASPLTKNRTTVDVVPMHIEGVSALAPRVSDSDLLSEAEWTKNDSLPRTTDAPLETVQPVVPDSIPPLVPNV